VGDGGRAPSGASDLTGDGCGRVGVVAEVRCSKDSLRSAMSHPCVKLKPKSAQPAHADAATKELIMKVLVSTKDLQGSAAGDYQWTVDGELVAVGSLDCDYPDCGCRRGFPGLASSKATTTALVVERSQMTMDDLRTAVASWLERDGWFRLIDDLEEEEDMIDEFVDEIVHVCSDFVPGTVLGRDGNLVFARSAKAA